MLKTFLVFFGVSLYVSSYFFINDFGIWWTLLWSFCKILLWHWNGRSYFDKRYWKTTFSSFHEKKKMKKKSQPLARFSTEGLLKTSKSCLPKEKKTCVHALYVLSSSFIINTSFLFQEVRGQPKNQFQAKLISICAWISFLPATIRY